MLIICHTYCKLYNQKKKNTCFTKNPPLVKGVYKEDG